MTLEFRDDAAWAQAQDAADPLRGLRDQFLFPEAPAGAPGGPVLYFAGHSLGLQPRRAREYVLEEMEDWARYGVEGHFAARRPWVSYHELLTASTARLVGALPSEVVVMNTLTVNLHLLLVSFYRPTSSRFRIVIEAGAFPSDRYAVDSHARLHGRDPREVVVVATPRPGESVLRAEDLQALLAAQGDSVALLLLGQPNYLTGQAFDVPEVVRLARQHGARIGLDLAHGVGNLLLRLHDWDVDFAVWCNYKYLNAGPGGLGGAFVHQRFASAPELPRLAGWWGHDKERRFEMREQFQPIAGAEGWQLSNPPILQLAALRASMELFDQAGMQALRAKSERLTGYLEWLLLRLPEGLVSLVTPREPGSRGAMLTVRARKAPALVEALRAGGAICDLRPPDILRLAPAPLYCGFADVQRLVSHLRGSART